MAAVTTAASAAAARLGAALSDAQYFESSMVRVEDIRRQLDSRVVKEKLDAMKRVIALISLGKDASTFFPDVVKNVAAPSLEVKKLVYLYLVHYAEEKQDLALLAINSFQKDLSDHNQHIRALSLRVLSSIRVKVILQVVILAISTAAKDSSSYVRKAAAHAIGKVCALDPASKEMLEQPLQDLISDNSTQVTGSAIAAFAEVCPTEWSLIHPHYRRICTNLIHVDPWGQITIMNMLLQYARVHFADPYSNNASTSNDITFQKATTMRHPDLTLLLDSIAPTFYSMNNGVVASAISIYYHLATDDEFRAHAIKPLMRLVGISDDGGQAVGLNIAAAVAVRYPSVLIPYISEFYISSAHSTPIGNLRMKVITLICAAAGREGGIGSKPNVRRRLLFELKEYLSRSDKVLAASAARAIGFLATAHPPSTSTVVRVLSSIVASSSNSAVVTESIGVLRRLLQRHPSAQAKALPQLIVMLLSDSDAKQDPISEPAARASVIWLIGEFYDKVQNVAVEALRLLARGFAGEAAEVKLQILNLATKLVARSVIAKTPNPTLDQLLEFIIASAQYDKDYDVRDKARMLLHLFGSDSRPKLREKACHAFLLQKPIPSGGTGQSIQDLTEEYIDPEVVIGSMAHVMGGRRLPGFTRLEPWANMDSDTALRNEIIGDGHGAAVNREYRGVSSADFAGTRLQQDNSVWEPPQGISSEMNGITSSLLQDLPGVGASNMSNAQRVTNVDPEKFYASDSEDEDESSEYDEESSDSSDDQDVRAEHSSKKHKDIETNSNILINTGDMVSEASRSDVNVNNKHNSEFDLDALLSNLPEVPSSAQKGEKNNSFPTLQPISSEGRAKTEYQRILEPWNSNGLEVDVAYCRNNLNNEPDVSLVVIRLTNRGAEKLSEIRFVSLHGDNFTTSQVIPVLDVDTSIELNAHAKFKGKMSGVGFRIESKEGTSDQCELKPGVGVVIRPYPEISPGGYLEAEKALTGMFGNECKVSLSKPADNDWMKFATTINRQILDICFVAHVKTSIGGNTSDLSERFSVMFAGYIPASSGNSLDKRPVLVRVTCYNNDDDSLSSCLLWVGCDDVLYGANLMKLCRSSLQLLDKNK